MFLALMLSLGAARAEFCPQYDGFILSDPMGATLGYLVVPQAPVGGLQPGSEYWRWMVPAFPPAFDVEGKTTPPPQSAWMGPLDVFAHGSFDVQGLQPYQPVQVTPEDRFYEITVETDGGTVLVGWMHRDQVSPLGHQHTWFGNPENLVQNQDGDYLLAPFGPHAVIHFRPGPQPPAGFLYAPLVTQ